MVDELMLLRQLFEADPEPDDPGLADSIKVRLTFETALDLEPTLNAEKTLSLPTTAQGQVMAKEPRLARPSWRRRRLLVLGGVAAGLLAAAVPVGLHIAGRSSGSGTTIRLASYALRLPATYHHVSSGAVPCNAGLLFGEGVIPGPDGLFSGAWGPAGLAARADEPALASAIDQAGGCVVIALNGPYTPGARNAPTVVTKPQVTEPVDVDGYQGWVGSWTWTATDFPLSLLGSLGMPPKTAVGTTQQVLNLTVPAPGGQVQELTVAATGVSQQQLLSLVTSGLTSSTRGTEGTSTVPVTSTTSPSATTTVPSATTTAPAATTTAL